MGPLPLAYTYWMLSVLTRASTSQLFRNEILDEGVSTYVVSCPISWLQSHFAVAGLLEYGLDSKLEYRLDSGLHSKLNL